MNSPEVLTTNDTKIPSRTLAAVNVQIDLLTAYQDHIYYLKPSQVQIDDVDCIGYL